MHRRSLLGGALAAALPAAARAAGPVDLLLVMAVDVSRSVDEDEARLQREGYRTEFRAVNHRHRRTGRSKYTNLGRLWASLSDLAGVIWLQSRARDPGGVDEA